MKQNRTKVLSCVATMVAMLGVSTVQAQTQPSRAMPPDPYDPQPANRQTGAAVPTQNAPAASYPAPNDYPAAEVQAIPPAFARVVELRWTMEQSRRDLTEAVDKLRDDFEHSSELQAAVRSQQTAHDRYLSTRNNALNQVHSDKRYVTLRKLADELKQQIENMQQENPKLTAAEVKPLADLRLSYSTKATAMEVDALAADSAFQEAKQKLMDAALQVRQLRDNFERNVRRNVDFVSARNVFRNLNIAYLASDAYYQSALDARNIALTYAYWLHRYDYYRYASAAYPYYNSYYDNYRNPNVYNAGYYQYTYQPAYPWMNR